MSLYSFKKYSKATINFKFPVKSSHYMEQEVEFSSWNKALCILFFYWYHEAMPNCGAINKSSVSKRWNKYTSFSYLLCQQQVVVIVILYFTLLLTNNQAQFTIIIIEQCIYIVCCIYLLCEITAQAPLQISTVPRLLFHGFVSLLSKCYLTNKVNYPRSPTTTTKIKENLLIFLRELYFRLLFLFSHNFLLLLYFAIYFYRFMIRKTHEEFLCVFILIGFCCYHFKYIFIYTRAIIH